MNLGDVEIVYEERRARRKSPSEACAEDEDGRQFINQIGGIVRWKLLIRLLTARYESVREDGIFDRCRG